MHSQWKIFFFFLDKCYSKFKLWICVVCVFVTCVEPSQSPRQSTDSSPSLWFHSLHLQLLLLHTCCSSASSALTFKLWEKRSQALECSRYFSGTLAGSPVDLVLLKFPVALCVSARIKLPLSSLFSPVPPQVSSFMVLVLPRCCCSHSLDPYLLSCVPLLHSLKLPLIKDSGFIPLHITESIKSLWLPLLPPPCFWVLLHPTTYTNWNKIIFILLFIENKTQALALCKVLAMIVVIELIVNTISIIRILYPWEGHGIWAIFNLSILWFGNKKKKRQKCPLNGGRLLFIFLRVLQVHCLSCCSCLAG